MTASWLKAEQQPKVPAIETKELFMLQNLKDAFHSYFIKRLGLEGA